MEGYEVLGAENWDLYMNQSGYFAQLSNRIPFHYLEKYRDDIKWRENLYNEDKLIYIRIHANQIAADLTILAMTPINSLEIEHITTRIYRINNLYEKNIIDKTRFDEIIRLYSLFADKIFNRYFPNREI